MITVEQAKSILTDNIIALSAVEKINANDAMGRTLAEDIYASINLPPFNQSNVDGYAVRLSDIAKNISWNVISEIKAGDNPTFILKEGEAVRIFTGAMVPEGADLIIMQEKIVRDKNVIYFSEPTEIKIGDHIRKEGAQVIKGDVVLNKGLLLNPSSIGFLNALGLTEINVFSKPRIALIITGNELQAPGEFLEKGKVFESNSVALQCAISAMGFHTAKTIHVMDDKKSLEAAVAQGFRDVDLLLISGGISVGDYDFVNEVLKENGTETLFYKIAQKPGKPLFFGKNKNTFIFGLPGNPASALTCFYEYVYPALRKMQGRSNIFLNSLQMPISKRILKKRSLANFLKAKINNGIVESLEGQESFKMNSFAEANAFIYLPKEKENVEAGEMVEVHLLPEV
jgi:molybdopterin molybdotransferase